MGILGIFHNTFVLHTTYKKFSSLFFHTFTKIVGKLALNENELYRFMLDENMNINTFSTPNCIVCQLTQQIYEAIRILVVN